MNSLLSDINTQAVREASLNIIIAENVDKLTEYLSLTNLQLNETISAWLSDVKLKIVNGELEPSKKENVVRILGVLDALVNVDISHKLDTGDLGSLLYKAGDKDPITSNAGLHGLLKMSKNDIVKSFIDRASKAVDLPNDIHTYIASIQNNITRVMNKKIAGERLAQ